MVTTYNFKYSGTLLIWSPMGPKSVVVITDDCINKGFFLKRMHGHFCRAAKKKMAIGRGSAVLDNVVVQCQKVCPF